MQKLKALYREKHDEIWELVRYVVAGALTTLVAVVVSYGTYMLLAEDHTINGANAAQTAIGTALSWIVAVVASFWMNRRMVFRVQYAAWRERAVAFFQFAGARAVSFLLFETGLFQLLKLIGLENTINRLAVLVVVIIFNYIASKFWIFKQKDEPRGKP